MRPDRDQIKRALKDVAWEYDAMLAAALEMVKAHGSPINHLVQEAFLTHVRNLAEFFRSGIEDFRKARAPEPPARPEKKDNIYAVDFCVSVGWKPENFGKDRKLIKAINKTLSHMTYSRDRASRTHEHFEGHWHLHGTVKLMRQTWGEFLKSVDPRLLRPENPEDIPYWLTYHTRDWDVKFDALESQFEARVHELARQRPDYWVLDRTPDGPV